MSVNENAKASTSAQNHADTQATRHDGEPQSTHDPKLDDPSEPKTFHKGNTAHKKPDFSHRINSIFDDEYCFEDAVISPLDQAFAIINSIQQQFTGESSLLSDEINFHTLEAAGNAILDAKAIIKHFTCAEDKDGAQ